MDAAYVLCDPLNVFTYPGKCGLKIIVFSLDINEESLLCHFLPLKMKYGLDTSEAAIRQWSHSIKFPPTQLQTGLSGYKVFKPF